MMNMIMKIRMINNFSEFQLLARQIATKEGGALELSSRSQELKNSDLEFLELRSASLRELHLPTTIPASFL